MINAEGPAGTLAALRASNPAPMVVPMLGPEPGNPAGTVDEDSGDVLAQHGVQLADHAARLDRLEAASHAHDDAEDGGEP